MNMLVGVLMLLVVKKMKMTQPLPKKEMVHKRKKMTPKRSVMRGCWGGKVPQWGWTTLFKSSGKLSRWEAPGG
jgi:hypothetical protein